MARWLLQLDRKITLILKKIGFSFLRFSLALVFIWFGLQKMFNLSPAEELVTQTVYWFDPSWFVPFLGGWEVAIGICLLWKPLLRAGLLLMAVQMVGTFLPFLLLPEVVFGAQPYLLTLEGQYILKNVVLIAAGMVVGSHVRDRKAQ